MPWGPGLGVETSHGSPRPAACGGSRRCLHTDVATSHPYNFFAFGDTPILIEDPEGNKVRSIQIHSCIICITTFLHRTPTRNQVAPLYSNTPVTLDPPSLPRVPGFLPISGKSHTHLCTAHLRTFTTEPPWPRPTHTYPRGVSHVPQGWCADHSW